VTPTSDVPTIHPLDGPGVAAVADELADLYARCYAEPPWSEGPDDVARYRTRLAAWATEAAFTGLLARRRDGSLAGATYGWVGPPSLRHVPLPGLGPGPVFHVGDLMTHPDHRRHGLGRRLLDTLVAGRRPAALVTHPDSGARRLYDAAGWAATGTVAVPGIDPLLTYVLAE
jgi:GNAT superfamily N-acetyltransferase